MADFQFINKKVANISNPSCENDVAQNDRDSRFGLARSLGNFVHVNRHIALGFTSKLMWEIGHVYGVSATIVDQKHEQLSSD